MLFLQCAISSLVTCFELGLLLTVSVCQSVIINLLIKNILIYLLTYVNT